MGTRSLHTTTQGVAAVISVLTIIILGLRMLLYSFLGSLLDRNTLNDMARLFFQSLLLTFHIDYVISFHVWCITMFTYTNPNMLWSEPQAPKTPDDLDSLGS